MVLSCNASAQLRSIGCLLSSLPAFKLSAAEAPSYAAGSPWTDAKAWCRCSELWEVGMPDIVERYSDPSYLKAFRGMA